MISPGVVIGSIGLAITLADHCLQGYRFFLQAAGMKEDGPHLRISLEIQYGRFQDWVAISGILDASLNEEESNLEAIKADRLLIIAILTQIVQILDEFARLNGKYIDLQGKVSEEDQEAANAVNLQSKASSIFERDRKVREKKRSLRGTNHLMDMAKRSKSRISCIIESPRRLVWAAWDAKAFHELVGRLEEYNDYLDRLLGSHKEKELERLHNQTLLGVLAIQSTVDRLDSFSKELSSLTGLTNADRRALRYLALFKREKLIQERHCSPSEYVPRHQLSKSDLHVHPDGGPLPDDAAPPLHADSYIATRSRGVYENVKDCKRDVWIEWKAYNTIPDDRTHSLIPVANDVRRVDHLAELLKIENAPSTFGVMSCLGWFDDRADNREGLKRFGLVFPASACNRTPTSLLQLLLSSSAPSLDIRVQLARRLIDGITYFHAIGWLHKAIRSDNILLCSESVDDSQYSSAFLSGFDYSRPNLEDATHSGTAKSGKKKQWLFYEHPSYQDPQNRGTFKRSYDIYSLGVVLIEIAIWQPIDKIVGYPNPNATSKAELGNVRNRLLDPEIQGKIKVFMGKKYHEAIIACIEGGEALGILEDDDESDPNIAFRVQDNFIAQVADKLDNLNL